jgi:hypothetical protein
MRTILSLLLCASLASAVEPTWVSVPILRTVRRSASPTYDDIMARCKNPYRGDSVAVEAHESNHLICSQVALAEFSRRRLTNSRFIEALYCLNGRAAVIVQPRTTMRKVITILPPKLRGRNEVWSLYFAGSNLAQHDDYPYDILNEWVAYANGAQVAVESSMGQVETDGHLRATAEFSGYSIALAYVIRKNLPTYDDDEFKRFMVWHLSRCRKLTKGNAAADVHWNIIATDPNAEFLRQFCRDYFGDEWCRGKFGW